MKRITLLVAVLLLSQNLLFSQKKETKLNLYKTIKKNYDFEQYLDVLNKENRVSITRIRMSNHHFPIEKMRYMKIKREQRICTICNDNQVGMKCITYRIVKIKV